MRRYIVVLYIIHRTHDNNHFYNSYSNTNDMRYYNKYSLPSLRNTVLNTQIRDYIQTTKSLGLNLQYSDYTKNPNTFWAVDF